MRQRLGRFGQQYVSFDHLLFTCIIYYYINEILPLKHGIVVRRAPNNTKKHILNVRDTRNIYYDFREMFIISEMVGNIYNFICFAIFIISYMLRNIYNFITLYAWQHLYNFIMLGRQYL